MDDVPLLPIISDKIIGSRLTPVKHRSVTPQKAVTIIVRSNSVTKKAQLAQSVAEVQEPTLLPQKYISKRKLRKWENANMVLLHKFLAKHGLNQSMKLQNSIYTKDNRQSLFSSLNMNSSDRESFLTFVQPKPKVVPSIRRGNATREKLSQVFIPILIRTPSPYLC